jgi:1-acyl-sn-glycerol-3-phosphate acyltransferase
MCQAFFNALKMNNLKTKEAHRTCLENDSNAPQKTSTLLRGRGVFRLIGIAVIIIGHLLPIVIGRFLFKKDMWWAVMRRQVMARHLVRFLNIRIEQTGKAVVGNFLYISNHRSYIDPVCVALWIPFVPIAKAEVGKWLLIGWGARMTGVFYVKRADKASRNSVREAARQVLKEGQAVLVYPEGTTTTKSQTSPFRAGTFVVAAEENIPVVPIAIAYDSEAAAFVDKDTFLPHFLKVFSQKQLRVRLHFFDALSRHDPNLLLQESQKLIDNQLAIWANSGEAKQRL